MDKKKYLLQNSLAHLMEQEIPLINALVERYPQAKVTIKLDGSPVTELDLVLSAHIEQLMQRHFPKFTFYSEEKFFDWNFPLLALDPLDGTQEYIAGRNEWAISIGIFQDENFSGEGWVYNPQTSECFNKAEARPFKQKQKYSGEVSRSEWHQGLFEEKINSNYQLGPMGSIAYKLGRLAAGKCDFVVSLRPKNIWDIAGGTLLCHQGGLKLYSQGKEVTKVQKIYSPPLIWCHEEIFEELSAIYP